jgi:hypothetical protein
VSTLRDDESEQELDEAEAAEQLEALPHDADDLPPIDFSTFVVSLRTSAMLHLEGGHDVEHGGDAVDAGPRARERRRDDLAFARQEIDLLGILEEKTRGNLTGEEERLLSQILFDLRTRYLTVRDRHRSGLSPAPRGA